MKCPHCSTGIHENMEPKEIWRTGSKKRDDVYVGLRWQMCPECKRPIIRLVLSGVGDGKVSDDLMVYPKSTARPPAPNEVPPQLAQDYREACLVLADSPKASAALSRRCLQGILRGAAGVKKADLSKEIEEVLPALPSHLAKALDAVRHTGNFAAHPMKSTHSGEILDVEPGEADWSLDVLEGMFDFYFVQPALLKAKREALNKKLTEVGKPPMK